MERQTVRLCAPPRRSQTDSRIVWSDTPYCLVGHTDGPRRGFRMYCPVGHRGRFEASGAPSDISRLPLPAAGEAQIQGSLTARAPAQAGGAGSSPAPVAKPDLTTMVLDIVTAQLDDLDRRRETARHPQPIETSPIAGPIPQQKAPAGAVVIPLRVYGCPRP